MCGNTLLADVAEVVLNKCMKPPNAHDKHRAVMFSYEFVEDFNHESDSNDGVYGLDYKFL